MVASDVIRIGRNLVAAASVAACRTFTPCSNRWFANSTIRIPFLVIRPISVTAPISLNIFSEIGAVTLIGLITKNGILIVEFANQRLEHGVNVLQAATEAAATRFRPILMTSLATMLGALPIALSMGAASGSRVGLGVVVVGGMLYSTVLSLIVIPSLYVVMSKLKKVHES